MKKLRTLLARPFELWCLHQSRKRYLAQETQGVVNALTGKLHYKEGPKQGNSLSPKDTARIVAYHLHRGADPNARVQVPVKAEVFGMGPYRALRRKRSLLSLCLQEPEVVEALVAGGARFDRSALEMAVALYNWPYRTRVDYAQSTHPLPNLPDPVRDSLEFVFSRGQIHTPLDQPFLDLHDRRVRPAHAILGRFVPALQSQQEADALADATPRVAPSQTPPPRL